MKRSVTFFPYRTPSADAVLDCEWVLGVGDSALEEMPSSLDSFDYGSPLTVGCRLEIDGDRLRSEAGLSGDARVGAAVTIDCPPAFYRTVNVTGIPSGQGSVTATAVADAGQVAGGLEISCTIVLLAPDSAAEADAATHAAARLVEVGRRSIQLEGSWARFPVQGVPFRTHYLPDAAWSLQVDYDEPDESFMGSVRLLVNTEHPAGQMALSDKETEAVRLVRSALTADTVRMLLRSLATDTRFRTTRRAEEGTLLGVAQAMAEDLLRQSLDSVLDLVTHDPIRFDALVDERMNYLRPPENAGS